MSNDRHPAGKSWGELALGLWRRAVRETLWSWRRLVGVSFVLFATLMLVSKACAGPPAAAPAAVVPLVQAGTPKPSPSLSAAPSPSDLASYVVTRFITAYGTQGTQPQWAAGLAPFSTPELASGLSLASNARVPALVPTGSPKALGSDAAVVAYAVPTSAGSVVVTVAGTTDPRVASVSPPVR